MLKNSARLSHEAICELALDAARNGGEGRANAVLVLPLKSITDAYLVLQRKVRSESSQMNQFCLAMRAISDKIAFLVIPHTI
jgi:hypothetical protein